ncbi:toll/interleukin-1 receptor domain-containing protein [Paenibacillus sp. MER TA 81-3]|uniref:toll/interleukin-1 receptor domain-containing protein n=1 Tax=Paenibacillus sp. MER TA 81-3 TaxID=2939573 RepID=UPI002040272E|nr:toll/interleukin-1 receptor domain-containing protein [Paenibacillus sp. MER TA 81-3]MCM3342724.1 toll/interleukin-1 receptor domain-containing protein [Paenibacillus sp. MER TA 81-3]
MSSIFLCHTSIDKPFVEKLARDLRRIGVNVWFDKWEIKVGDSLTWKIEEGIRENEFLGIVLSPEALKSEWVKSELGAAWSKQMKTRKVFVLPIFYRECEMPYFLSDRKYADFRIDYEHGFSELAGIFGIDETEVITQDNWRKFTRKKKVNWKSFKTKEFEQLVTTLVDRAYEYKWSAWVGGTANEYSISFYCSIKKDDTFIHNYISFKLVGESNAYNASFKKESNPNNLKVSDYEKYIGNSIDACDECLWRFMDDSNSIYGTPTEKPFYFTERFSRGNELHEAAKEMMRRFNWYKGDKL